MTTEAERRIDAAHRALNHCPAWCVYGDEAGPDDSYFHYGPPTTLFLTGPDGPMEAVVRAEYIDWPPGYVGNVADHEWYPTVAITIPDFGELDLPPDQARALCAAILQQADAIEANPIQPRT
jgi:hypothetical protein